jgi:Na+-transporting NADH:ubiquinone oxidoreductase subunit A
MVRIKKGLDLPITGVPKQIIEQGKTVKTIALLGSDYVGMKPTMRVQVGDLVKTGQPLFDCKKNLGLTYTSPASGKVLELNRGEKRVFQSVVIELDSSDSSVEFTNYKNTEPKDLKFEDVRDLLQESGLWTALRERPFSRVAAIGGRPHSVFITAIDTNPLCADPSLVLKEYTDDFKNGVKVLTKLTEGKTYLCKKTGADIPAPECNDVEVKEFAGVHPAGNVGTHIHFVDPVHANKTVWHINYQDVVAVGKLFSTGKLWVERIVSLAGPVVGNPRLMKTRLGANISELTHEEFKSTAVRVISGSVLNGTTAQGPMKFLGRYHNQISAVEEDDSREFMGWQKPGFDKFSVKRTYLGRLIPGKKFGMTSNLNGSPRAMVPVGIFEGLMPLDILPTQLLRALVCRDTDSAQALGCLELDEEDLGLMTFASPGKVDFGPILRENLSIIEKEG